MEKSEVASKRTFLAHFNLGFKNEYEFGNGIECFEFIKEFDIETKIKNNLSELSTAGYSATHQDGCPKNTVDYSYIEIEKDGGNYNIPDKKTNIKNMPDILVTVNSEIISKKSTVYDESSNKSVFENLKEGSNLNHIELVFENCDSTIKVDEKKNVEQPAKKFNCNICEKNFVTKIDRLKHIKIHLKTHICPFCAKTFTEKNELLNHCTLHLTQKSNQTQSSNVKNPKKLQCKVCSKCFTTAYNVKRHLRDVHHIRKALNKTSSKHLLIKTKIGKPAVQKKDAQHEGNKENKKSIKKKQTSSKHSLKKGKIDDINGYGKEVQYQGNKENKKHFTKKCPICLKYYHARIALERHIKIVHENQKHFKCKICKKAFASNYHLKRHLTIHTVIKAYTCRVCFKLYTTNANLIKHTRNNHPEEKVKCKICYKTCMNELYLRKHLIEHSECFKCPICYKKYPNKLKLLQHTLNAHLKQKQKIN